MHLNIFRQVGGCNHHHLLIETTPEFSQASSSSTRHRIISVASEQSPQLPKNISLSLFLFNRTWHDQHVEGEPRCYHVLGQMECSFMIPCTNELSSYSCCDMVPITASPKCSKQMTSVACSMSRSLRAIFTHIHSQWSSYKIGNQTT